MKTQKVTKPKTSLQFPLILLKVHWDDCIYTTYYVDGSDAYSYEYEGCYNIDYDFGYYDWDYYSYAEWDYDHWDYYSYGSYEGYYEHDHADDYYYDGYYADWYYDWDYDWDYEDAYGRINDVL